MNQNTIDALYAVTQISGRDYKQAEKLALEIVIDWMVEHGYTEIPVQDDSNTISYARIHDVEDEDLDHGIAWLPRDVFDNRTPGGGWNPVVRLARLQAYTA